MHWVRLDVAPLGCRTQYLAKRALQVMNCLPGQTFRQLGIEHRLNPLSGDLAQREVTEGGLQVHSEKIPVRLLGCVLQSGQDDWLPVRLDKISELAS